MRLSSKVEALLFYKGEPVQTKKIMDLLGCGQDELAAAFAELEEALSGRGLQLVRANDTVLLGTAAAASPLIESIQRDEISRDLGKAGLETLAIVLYKGPISRREIDYVRGVNSSFILRNLLVRGLVERLESEKERGYLYRATPELLSFMGISKLEDLPEYESVRGEIEQLASTENEQPDPETAE